MDPITQGALGATYSQSFSKKNDFLIAAICGILGGMAPDLDVLIQSSTDPMVYFEYHRQFTHSLLFIPFGSFIVAWVLNLFFKKNFKKIYLYTFLGYATHGLLDACTSYGTMLLWPVSMKRFAWNNISIIDPLFTIPLIILCLIGVIKKNQKFSRIAIVYSLMYLSLGFFLQNHTHSKAIAHAHSLGHMIERAHVKPSFANLYLWRGVYKWEKRIYALGLRLDGKKFVGDSKASFELEDSSIEKGSTHWKDLETFSWFSDNFLVIEGDVIGDARYSLLPNTINPLWGVKLNADQSQHVKRVSSRGDVKVSIEKFMDMLAN